MLAVSTSWDLKPENDVYQWLKRIKSWGVDGIELSYTLNKQQVSDIKKVLPDLGLKVASLHNYCPVPDDSASERHISNFYRLSSLDKAERLKAVDWTKMTIDTAKSVGGAFVVIHAGTLDFDPVQGKLLIELYKQGKAGGDEYKRAKDEFVAWRKKNESPYLDVLTSSLEKVMDHAHALRIPIGLETRYYPFEIPNFEEIGMFLKRFTSKGMYYWHDVGHAEISERLGFHRHTDFLKAYQTQLKGVHIHGMKLARDHLAPFAGDMDLVKVFPYLKKDTVCVVETRLATEEEMRLGIEKLMAVRSNQ